MNSTRFYAGFAPLILGLFFLLPVRAAEIFVDGKGAAGGTGTAALPYQTIKEAISKAAGGMTITIKGGVYRESVSVNKGGDSGAPLVIRAAPGERVEVTGFDALTGWKMDGKLAKLTVKDPIYDLYVGQTRQRMSRFPDKMSPWFDLTAATDDSYQVETLPPVPPVEFKGLCLALLVRDLNNDWSLPVINVDVATKTIKVAHVKARFKVQAGDHFVYYNAPSFIKYPGDWSCQPADGGYQVTFLPNDPKDLKKTQFRKRPIAISVSKVSDVTLRGLEITGGRDTGLNVLDAKNFKLERCLVYNNALNGPAPNGIMMINCENALVDSCVIFSNFRGLNLTQGKENVVKGCEIFQNDNDGINYTGRRSREGEPALHPTLTHCYMHGHIYLQHADNFQVWGLIKDIQYDHNLSILAGQNMMMEDFTDIRAQDSVLFSTGAHQAIFGGPYTSGADFHNMTFLWGNLGSFGLYDTSKGLRNFKNVFYASPVSYAGTDLKAGDNLFWSPSPEANLVTWRDESKKIYAYKKVADIGGAGIATSGLEINSQQVDPQFKNIPEAQAVSNNPTANTPDTLFFSKPGSRQSSLAGFSKGDTIEINFDGVPRTIQSMTDKSITFAPALSAAPFRDVTVWGWGKRTNLQIDLTSPVVGGKNQPGASLDVAAYQRGELDGSGKRSIPELSEEARGALIDPAVYPFPFSIPKLREAKPAPSAPATPALREPE